MVKQKRNSLLWAIIVVGLFGIINAQSNWIFYGTNLTEKVDDEVQTTPLTGIFGGRNPAKIEKLRRYLKVNADESASVLRNFKQTPIIRKEVRDKAYYDDQLLDHACPVTIRASEHRSTKRVPDIIGVGFAKCGTGALAFLDCHPRAVFRTTEPRFFDQENRLKTIIDAHRNGNYAKLRQLREAYYSRLPLAAKDEILIEKSPQYAGGSEQIRELRAKAMKIINPNVKIIAVICDPVRRVFSQLSMKDRRTKDRQKQGRPNAHKCRSCLRGNLTEAIGRFTENMKGHLATNRESGYAAFSNYLRPFIKVMGEENVLIVDGENLIKNANFEFDRIVDFMGLSNEHFNFFTPDAKGFPCLHEPIKFCLNAAKGTSRKTDVTKLHPDKTEIWKKVFTPSIQNTIVSFKICPHLDEACCNKLKTRFTWAAKYFC